MPEHREKTPENLRDLASFLWHDFGTELGSWIDWLGRKHPAVTRTDAEAAFGDAIRLHETLRRLEATNNGILVEEEASAYCSLNGLISHLDIRPRLGECGIFWLASKRDADPVAALLITALELMALGEWRRFKLCRAPACRASYYDASKAAVKTWCSMATCGSRDKMRRHRVCMAVTNQANGASALC